MFGARCPSSACDGNHIKHAQVCLIWQIKEQTIVRRPAAQLVEQRAPQISGCGQGSVPAVALCCMSFPLSPLFPVYSSAVLSKK